MDKTILALMPLIRSMVCKAFRKCGFSFNEADVQDLQQDVLLKLIDGGLAKYDASKAELSTFVGSIAFNHTIDHCRTTHFGATLDGEGFVESDSDEPGKRSKHQPSSNGNPESAYSVKEQFEALRNAVNALSPVDRLIFEALHLDASAEMAQPVCEKTGLNLSNVRKRLCNVRAQLGIAA